MKRLNPEVTQRIATVCLWAAAGLALSVLAYIIILVLAKGLPVLTPHFLLASPERMGRAGGIFPTIVGSLALTLVALVVATPLGVGTAVYLTEYTQPGRLAAVIRFGVDCLAGVPSIIFGLFGFIFFVIRLGMGWSVLSGGLTLAVMILPTIIRTAEEAIRAVPGSYREASFSAGATSWQTITRVVLPAALPGVVTGIVLAIGRSIGETAAVIFTAGTALRLPTSLFASSRTMAVHFYILAREGLSMPRAYGTAAVLIILILLINTAANALMVRFRARTQ
ncbi:MAG: phosphate ABC transporter permease PstA [Armatimonadetes bacterium]|nr:phosphate ABC transporter permease PstA [Armatimonadota bacterium]